MKYELPSTELIVIEENNYLKFGEYLNDMQCDDTTNKLCLDDLEYVKKLQQENKILRENAEHNDKVVDKVNWENQLLKKENKQLKIQISAREEVCNRLESNWNKLKEWASNFYNSEEVGWAGCGIRYTLEKMKEIERSDSNE